MTCILHSTARHSTTQHSTSDHIRSQYMSNQNTTHHNITMRQTVTCDSMHSRINCDTMPCQCIHQHLSQEMYACRNSEPQGPEEDLKRELFESRLQAKTTDRSLDARHQRSDAPRPQDEADS